MQLGISHNQAHKIIMIKEQKNMAILATNKGNQLNIDPIDEGSFSARVYQVIHIGTISGFEGKMQNKVRITFELPTELHVFKEEKGEQPRVISNDYTLSFNEKATLRKVIQGCDPQGLKIDDNGIAEEYDVEKLIGKTCLVTIKHRLGKDGKVYAGIDNVTILPKGMNCPDAINEPKILSYDNWDKDFFESLPDFLKDKMKSSLEYQAMFESMIADPNSIPF